MYSMSHYNMVIDHHIVHLLVGFIRDPAGQLNTSANSGELTTARALQLTITLMKHFFMVYDSPHTGLKMKYYCS